MSALYVEPSIPISSTIIDRARISRWGRTRRSHDLFSRLHWDLWWRCLRSVDCTIGTNAAPPEIGRMCLTNAPPMLGFEICLRPAFPCESANFISKLRTTDQVVQLLGLCALRGGMTPAT